LAAHAAVDLLRYNLQGSKLVLFTFGQPRLGNKDFGIYMYGLIGFGNYFRVVHADDMVPHVPARKIGFSHSG
jgi:hypothetical protein